MVDTVISASAANPLTAIPPAANQPTTLLGTTLKTCRNIGRVLTGMAEAGLTGAAAGACIGAIVGICNRPEGYVGLNIPLLTGTLYGGIIASGIRLAAEVSDLFLYHYSIEYRPENDGVFPLCVRGKPIEFKRISPDSLDNKYHFSSAQKYLDISGLADLYHSQLEVKPYTEQDLPVDSKLRKYENTLIGQDKVVAKVAINRGDCVGIFGGDIESKDNIPDAEPFIVKHKDILKYSLDIGDDNVLISRNILSRVNTNIEYDAASRSYKESKQGYNTEIAWFPALTDEHKTRVIFISVMFATKPVAAGEELRCFRKYSPEFLQRLGE